MTAQQAARVTERLFARLQDRRRTAEKMDRYYRGRQPLMFASETWQKSHAQRYAGFSDNWCAPVANAPAERLRVTDFRLPGRDRATSPRSAAERKLWSAWEANALDQQSSQGFLAGIIANRSFALVWGDDDDQPVVTWETAGQMIVDHDPEVPRRRRFALKVWHEGDREHATLYTPDQVWKWQRRSVQVSDAGTATTSGLILPAGAAAGSAIAGGWEARQPDSDDTWPLANPLGVVPVVEMPNRPMLGGEPISDIDGTVAMQDAINLLWAYLFNAADYASMPARVVMGQEPPKVPILDSRGQKIGDREVDLQSLSDGRLLWLTGQKTSISQFDAAKLDVFTGVIETAVAHVAAQSRTPPHYLVANKGLSNVNGDGLKVAETGLVKKVEESQLYLTPEIRELFVLMALVLGQRTLVKAARGGHVSWHDAESRSEAQLVDALQKLRSMGFPWQWIAERYGLTSVEIERLVDMRRQEAELDTLGGLRRLVDPDLEPTDPPQDDPPAA